MGRICKRLTLYEFFSCVNLKYVLKLEFVANVGVASLFSFFCEKWKNSKYLSTFETDGAVALEAPFIIYAVL